jgi:hypothetical protein
MRLIRAAGLLLLLAACETSPATSAFNILEGNSPLRLTAQVTYVASKKMFTLEASVINCTDQIILLRHIGPECLIEEWAAEDEDGFPVAQGGESGWRGPICYRELGVAEAPGVYSSKTWPLVTRNITFDTSTHVTNDSPVNSKPEKIFRMTVVASFRVRDAQGPFEKISLFCRVTINRKP